MVSDLDSLISAAEKWLAGKHTVRDPGPIELVGSLLQHVRQQRSDLYVAARLIQDLQTHNGSFDEGKSSGRAELLAELEETGRVHNQIMQQQQMAAVATALDRLMARAADE